MMNNDNMLLLVAGMIFAHHDHDLKSAARKAIHLRQELQHQIDQLRIKGD